MKIQRTNGINNRNIRREDRTILTKISCDDLMGIYKDIAEILDVESAYKIFETLGGAQVNFPTRFYDNKRIKKLVKSEYTGNNTRELAKKFGYSERRIRQFLSGSNSENDN